MKVTSKDLSRLLTIMIVSKILFSDINVFVKSSGPAAYMEAVLCAVSGITIFLAISFFYKKIGCPDIFSSLEFSFGRIAKCVIGTLFFIFATIYTALSLKIYADAIITIAYPNSHVSFAMIFIVVAMVVTAYNGIDTVTKFCSVCLVSMLSLLVILFALALKNADVSNLFPIFGGGAKSIILGSKNFYMYNEILFLFFLSSYLERKEDAAKVGFKAILVSSAVIVASTFIYSLCVPYPVSKMFNMPLLQLASSTEIDIFFQRTEGIFFLLWIYSSFLYIGTSFYFTLYSFRKTYNSTDFKAIIPSLTVVTVIISAFFKSTDEVSEFYAAATWVFSIFAFAVPLLSFATEYFKMRRKNA